MNFVSKILLMETPFICILSLFFFLHFYSLIYFNLSPTFSYFFCPFFQTFSLSFFHSPIIICCLRCTYFLCTIIGWETESVCKKKHIESLGYNFMDDWEETRNKTCPLPTFVAMKSLLSVFAIQISLFLLKKNFHVSRRCFFVIFFLCLKIRFSLVAKLTSFLSVYISR